MIEALDRAKVDSLVCTGDVVGYGACPRECIDIVRERNIPTVKGNHDEYVTQVGGQWRIQPDAREGVLWTQKTISESHMAWLEALPRVLSLDGLQVLHASHAWWPRWSYVINERTAVHNFVFQPSRITFNGHTHVPLCVSHQAQHMPQLEMLHNMFLPRTPRLLVGVGSVGQPRDGDPRACGVVYDTESGAIRLVRVAYDVETAQARIRKAGLPDELAVRLAQGR
jgi:diadenosine tetraphosphatase ApaH/serine/threonine PP2A family protein phosphatase